MDVTDVSEARNEEGSKDKEEDACFSSIEEVEAKEEKLLCKEDEGEGSDGPSESIV